MIKEISLIVVLGLLSGCIEPKKAESIEVQEFKVIGVQKGGYKFSNGLHLENMSDKTIVRNVIVSNSCSVQIGSVWKFYRTKYKYGDGSTAVEVESIGDFCEQVNSK